MKHMYFNQKPFSVLFSDYLYLSNEALSCFLDLQISKYDYLLSKVVKGLVND